MAGRGSEEQGNSESVSGAILVGIRAVSGSRGQPAPT
jgi:hypothetical protein